MAGSFSSTVSRIASRPVTRASAPSGIISNPHLSGGRPGAQVHGGPVHRAPGVVAPPLTPQQTAAGAAPAPPPPPATITVTPPPPDLSGDKWQAYLTPDQLNALQQAKITDTQGVGDWNQRATDAQAEYDRATANAQYQHDVNTQQANEALAARGLFSSSIRANDLTDINRTLADTQAAAYATLNTLVGEATRAITALNSSWGATQIGYQGIAGANAAALPANQPYQAPNPAYQASVRDPALGTPPPTAAPPTPSQPISPNPQNPFWGIAKGNHWGAPAPARPQRQGFSSTVRRVR